jgi:hypothetical protein
MCKRKRSWTLIIARCLQRSGQVANTLLAEFANVESVVPQAFGRVIGCVICSMAVNPPATG